MIREIYNNIKKNSQIKFYENRYNNIKKKWKYPNKIKWTNEEKKKLYFFQRSRFYDYIFKLERYRTERGNIFGVNDTSPVASNILLWEEQHRLNKILKEGIQPDIYNDIVSTFEYYYEKVLKQFWEDKIKQLQ